MPAWPVLIALATPLAVVLARVCLCFSEAYAAAVALGEPIDSATLRRALLLGLQTERWKNQHLYGVLICVAVLLAGFLPFALIPHTLHAAHFIACVILLMLGLIDLRCGLLPDALTLPLMWAGLLLSWAGLGVRLEDAVIAAAVGYGLLRALDTVFEFIRGRPGLGGGDMKLMAALGAWLGWQVLPAILLGACASGLLYAVLFKRGSLLQASLPFGPHLAAAGVAVLVGHPVVQYFFI